MNLYQQFQTDEQAEVEGVWIPLDATAKIKVARLGNARHQAATKRLLAPYVTAGMRVTDIPDDQYNDVSREAMAEAILLDWDGIVNDRNEPVPYSKAEGLAALKMKDFYKLVERLAGSMENFRVARQQALEKN